MVEKLYNPCTQFHRNVRHISSVHRDFSAHRDLFAYCDLYILLLTYLLTYLVMSFR